MTEIVSPFAQFFGTNGAPLNNGNIYIGTAYLDAQTNAIPVYWDDALTIPALQPIRTLNGYAVRSGAPARIFCNAANFSMTVQTSTGRTVWAVQDATSVNIPSISGPDGSSQVGFIQAGAGAEARTAQAKMRDIVSVKDYGAVGDNVTNDFLAVQNAVYAAGVLGKTLIWPAGNYKITGSITLPQNTLLTMKGEGYRNTFIRFSGGAGFAGFNYAREGAAASGFVFEDLAFVWDGTARLAGSSAIKSYGASDAYSDNYLRCYRCAFYFFESAIETKWSGQCYFSDCFFQVNTRSFKMLRGSSFFYMRGIMSFDATFIFAQDTTYDAFSNGLLLDMCHSITAIDMSMYVEGWQAVYVDKCGFDLGSGGPAAVKIFKCTDGAFTDCYVSSNNSITRAGILFDTSHTFVVRGGTIVNNSVGLYVIGQNGVATKIVVDGVKFDGNDTNDVLGLSYATGCKLVNNHHVKQMSRTGASFEIYLNTTGTDYNIVQFNTLKGTTYAIVGGANSVIGNNIFGCPAG